MPVFATGHAHFKFLDALTTMRGALAAARTNVERVLVVVYDADWADDAERILLYR